MHPFLSFLQHRLQHPLPGWDAHQRMSPLAAEVRKGAMPPIEKVKQSAVLVLLTEQEQQPQLLFTLRSSKLNTHSGQISYPGGRMEPNESSLETALRETTEEVGIAPEHLHIVGPLSQLYVPPSNSLVHPHVAWLPALPPLAINPDEVDEAFLVPLPSLLGPDRRWDVDRQIFNGTTARVPGWNVHPATPLWGATAMITSELLILWEEFVTR